MEVVEEIIRYNMLFINSGGDKGAVVQKLKEIRRDILDGDLKTNNSWDDPLNSDLIDAVKNTKHIYE